MGVEYLDSNLDYYTDVREILRKGKGILPWKTLDTRLHVPLIEGAEKPHIAIDPSGSIDRRTTAHLTGYDTEDGTQRFCLTDFRDRQGKPVDAIGTPVFANLVDPIEGNQAFRGYELVMEPTGRCIMRGLGVEPEPVEITGMQPDHVRRFAEALTVGAKTHLCI